MKLVLVLENIRSAHNVGAIFRTAEAAGVSELILTGYTPYPLLPRDLRPPHVADRAARLIAKTALGAEHLVPFRVNSDPLAAIAELRHNQYHIAALELAEGAQNLFHRPPRPALLALVLGHEVEGVSQPVLAACDQVLMVPMVGRKESLNVAVAAGIAAYTLLFGPD